MSALLHLSGKARRAALPRRTVRLRLTALYGTLFLASGAGLLTITNLLARGWSSPPLGVVTPVGMSARGISAVTTHIEAGFAARLAAEHATELNQLLAESGIALGVMTVISAVLGWLVAGRVLRPLRVMTTTARAISADDLSKRLAVPGPDDELKDLADTIDGLLGGLETAFAAQRRFAASASHELRTPLAMMRTSLDVATAKPGPIPGELTVLAGKLREGLDQADHLVENLLLLARAQHSAGDGQETACLDPLISAAIDARAAQIATMDLHVQHAPADGTDCMISGNRVLLAQMTGNLVDNAVRHNDLGGWIRAQVTRDGSAVRLLVENGGPVLDPDKVASLAQPFRRLGADRTGSAAGTGLGLSITEAIAAAHGGTLHLEARADGGLRAVIDLPACDHTETATQLVVAGGDR